jgi:hypothetical protein
LDERLQLLVAGVSILVTDVQVQTAGIQAQQFEEQSSLSIKAPSNNLAAFKQMQNYAFFGPEVSERVMNRIQHHSWYLSEQICVRFGR